MKRKTTTPPAPPAWTIPEAPASGDGPPPAAPRTDLATLDPAGLDLARGDLDTILDLMAEGDALAVAGAVDEDIPPARDWSLDPIMIGIVLGATLVEVESEHTPGALDAVIVIGVATPAGIEAVWCGAHLEATFRRILSLSREMPDRASRSVDQWRAHVAEAGRVLEDVPVMIHQYGMGPQVKGRNAARLFKVATFPQLRGRLKKAPDLARFAGAIRSQLERASSSGPKNSPGATDAAL